MAIQQRRGAKADFDATKMLPGELAVTTDGSRKVYVAFAPGDAKELASTEDVEETIQSGIEEIEQKKEEALAQFPNYEDKIKELEIYKANSIKSTSSGTVFHETDCAEVKPINIKLFGKGEQEVIPGNQLFDKFISSGSNSTLTDDGLTVKSEEKTGEGYTSLFNANFDAIQLMAGKTYYVSIDIKLASGNMTRINNIQLMNISSTVIEKANLITSPKINSSYQRYVVKIDAEYDVEATKIYVQGYGATNAVVEATRFMISENNVDWEPYVGGEQSPNMNYPQEVECLGASGSIESGLGAENYCVSNSDFTTEEKGITKTKYKGKSKMRLQGIVNEQSYPISIEMNGRWGAINENAKLLKAGTKLYAFPNGISFDLYDWHDEKCIYFTGETTLETDFYLDEVFVRFESDYFPNGTIDETVEFILTDNLQPFTFQTPNGLRGIPLGQTIPDAIKNSPIHMSGVYWDNVEQQYYIGDTKNEDGKDVQRVGVLDNNNWRQNNILPTTTGYRFVNTVADMLAIGGVPILCTHFIQQKVSSYTVEGNYISSDESNVRFLNIRTDSTSPFSTTEEIIAWMNENNVKTYYILAEPIVTKSDVQYDVVMNYPNTTIVNDAGAYMEVEYVADTKKHIEQNYVSKEAYNEHESRIAELEKAIVNS